MIRDGSCKLRHVKGETLVAGFLKKAITVRASCQKFTSFVGMIDVAVKAAEPEGAEVKRLTKVLGLGLALGLTACLPRSVDRAVGLASLAIGLAKLYGDAIPKVDLAHEHPRVRALKRDQRPLGHQPPQLETERRAPSTRCHQERSTRAIGPETPSKSTRCHQEDSRPRGHSRAGRPKSIARVLEGARKNG